ncbi:MAG: hypothetical protein KAJ23_10020 [Maribacter sp.]|nr:hypothetical protein [Maribacter sp.]
MKKKFLKKQFWVILGLLVLCLGQPDVVYSQNENLDKIAVEKEKQRKLVKQLIAEINAKKKFSPDGFDNVYRLLGEHNPDYQLYLYTLKESYQRLSQAESNYRQILSAEIIAKAKSRQKGQTSQPTTKDYLYDRSQEAKENYERQQELARKLLAQSLREASSYEDKAKAYAMSEGLLRTSRLEYEMTVAAHSRVRKDGKGDILRMRNLLRDAKNNKTDVRLSEWENHKKKNLQDLVKRGFDGERELAKKKAEFLHWEKEEFKSFGDNHAIEAENWLRSQKLEADIDEYRRLASNGKIVNAKGNPITEKLRIEIAKEAELTMADMMKDRAVKSNVLQRLTGRVDGRLTQSENINSDIVGTPEYNALDFLDPGYTTTKPEYMLALAHAIRKEEEKIDKWRTDFIPEYKMSVGAADAHRIAGVAGEMSLASVDARIAKYHKEANAFAEALTAMAKTPNPEDLKETEHYMLLKNEHYIVPDGLGGEKYVFPPIGSISNLQNDLNLPGSHWINSISGKNMATALASVAVPEFAAGRVGVLLKGLGAAERTVIGGSKAADILVGMGTDATFEYIDNKKVDVEKLLIESTLLAGTLEGAGKATEVFSEALMAPINIPKLETFVKKSMGLAVETSLQTLYSKSDGNSELTYEDFFSGLVNGTISKAASSTTQKVKLPKWIKDLAKGQNNIDRLGQRYKEAEQRFKDIGGEDYVKGLEIAKAFPLSSTERLNANYGSDRLGTEKMTDRLTKSLESGEITWGDMIMLYADRPELRPVMAMINKRRDERFKSFVKDAQVAARRDVKGIYEAKAAEISATMEKGSNEYMLANAENREKYTNRLRDINTEPITPGSNNLTSDMDRSIKSDFVRKYLKETYRNRANGAKTPATSAQSWDVNEYIDVFPTIKNTLRLSGRLNKTMATKEFGGLTEAEVLRANLSHEEAVEANSHAAAMLHMNKGQRKKYKKNLYKNTDAAQRDLLKRQFMVSDRSLKVADTELRTEMNNLVANDPSLKNNQSDLATLARDNLYGRRTEAIAAKEFELSQLQKQIDNTIPERAGEMEKRRDLLAAEIERDWGYALREGVETYASFTGLDVVVNRGQAKKMSMRDMINNPDFNREQLKKEGFDYSDRQLDGFLRDQIMMMTHHMNGFNEKGESAVEATAAVGKYAERAVLALKLKGVDLSKEPYASLSKDAEILVKARKNPAELRKALEKIGGGEGRADEGLRKFSKMIMNGLPGTEGLYESGMAEAATDGNGPIGGDLRRTRGMLASQRRFEEEQARLAFAMGPATAAKKTAEKMDWVNNELIELKKEKGRRDHLGSKYLRKDWDKAEQLESELAGLDERVRILRELGAPFPKKLSDRRIAIRKELKEFEEFYKVDEHAKSLSNDKERHPDDIKLDNLIKSKEEEKERLGKSLKEFMDKADEEEKALAQEDPFAEPILSFSNEETNKEVLETAKVKFIAMNGISEKVPATMELVGGDGKQTYIFPELTQKVTPGIYKVKLDYISDYIADSELTNVKFTNETDTIVSSNHYGRLQMKAFDREDKPAKYLVLIYEGGNLLYTSEGFDQYFDLPSGNYNLMFSVAGEEVEKENISVSPGTITDVEVRLSELEDDKPDIYVETAKPVYTKEEEIEVNYAVKLPNELQGRQWALTLAEASSGVAEKKFFLAEMSIPPSGVVNFDKMKPGQYQIRVVLMTPPNRSGEGMFENLLAKTSFEVEGKVEEIKIPVPPNWAQGTLMNSNDGSCDAHKGKYLVFMNAGGGQFKNLKTGEINQFMSVGPGESLAVAAPVLSAWIRVFSSDARPADPSKVPRSSISYGTISHLVDGWWFQAGCNDGTHRDTPCDNGRGDGGSTPFDCTTRQ